MKLQVINIDGKKTENIELSDKIFSVKPNKYLIQSIVDWQLNHFKPRTAKTKQRNEVKGSTAKIYAQKVLEEQGIRVEKRQYLLVVELLMAQKDQFTKLKKLIKKLENLVCCIC